MESSNNGQVVCFPTTIQIGEHTARVQTRGAPKASWQKCIALDALYAPAVEVVNQVAPIPLDGRTDDLQGPPGCLSREELAVPSFLELEGRLVRNKVDECVA